MAESLPDRLTLIAISALAYVLEVGLHEHAGHASACVLLGSIGLMSAAGYPLFSGISGMGDLGTGAGGALQGARPEWLWRALLTVLGAIGYWLVARLSVRLIAPRLPGSGEARARRGKRITLISYVTGAVVYFAIGLLNPYGALIMLVSVLPSSLGGTSGLVWMMDWVAHEPEGSGANLNFVRGTGWIAAAAAVTLAYARVLGPR